LKRYQNAEAKFLYKTYFSHHLIFQQTQLFVGGNIRKSHAYRISELPATQWKVFWATRHGRPKMALIHHIAVSG
jgi:hypothetical protein